MPVLTLADKGRAFRALHERPGAFVIPNPWDVGSARLLAHLGFEALATTSAGAAFASGRPDNSLQRDEALAGAAAIASAVELPVSADLENGYGDSPETVAETIRLAAQAGLAGASIEDMLSDGSRSIYDIRHAAERVRAAVEVVRSLPFPFVLTARAENYLCGRPDIADTVARLQAYQEAGADVLYAPGITRREEIVVIVGAVERPVNVVMGLRGEPLTLATLSALGVKRVSVGGSLCRAAFGAFLRAAREMKERGTFEFVRDAVPHAEINAMFVDSSPSGSTKQ